MENMRHYLSALNSTDALYLGRRYQSFFVYGGPGNRNMSYLQETVVDKSSYRIRFEPRNAATPSGKGTRSTCV
jgi:hypothetical protein